MTTLDIFKIADDAELTSETLLSYIRKNDIIANKRYRKLQKAYNNDYKIFHVRKKDHNKPDNRIAINKARYLTDVFEGFHLGIPIKVTSDDADVSDYINGIEDAYNGDDINAELSTLVDIYGRAYRIAYVDEYGDIGSAYLDPIESFAIYNESITPKMRYFVRTYLDTNRVRRGSVADHSYIRYFYVDAGGNVVWTEEHPHGFDGVPAVEFVLNSARRGLFEDSMSMIDAYNKGVSEKANDVDYFSDAYMLVKGPKVDTDDAEFIRDTKIINLVSKGGTGTDNSDVRFLEKPASDETQEHLLDRLDREIYVTSMSCQTDDEKFGTASGIAIKYKLHAMASLSARKWRKWEECLKRFYKLICSNPVTPLKEDDWQSLKFTHAMNYPSSLSEEAVTASNLAGITSKKTQLSVLSIVDNVDAELEQIRKEALEEDAYETSYETKRTETEDGDDNGADNS